MKTSHPDDAHALVLNHILAMPRRSAESHSAFLAYQSTRLGTIRPKLMKQKTLLERALMGQPGLDAQVSALDDEISAAWLELDSRLWATPEVRE